ncbi:DUF2268 domain-containing protein [Patescibacteria group bacterium]|nr:DUF2268 domain-containing protein [Patescibacteria group bacterium]
MKTVNIHVMSADPALRPYARLIKKETSEALNLISKYILFNNIDICILQNPQAISYGVATSETTNEHTLSISLNVKHKNFKKLLHEELLGSLCHGLHFLSNYQKMGYPNTLIESFIQKGLAIHFEMAITNKNASIHCRVNKDELQKMIQKSKRYYFSRNYLINYDDWFYGSKKKKIPAYTMSALGYYFIKKYLKANPDKTIFDIVNKNIEKLVKDILGLED